MIKKMLKPLVLAACSAVLCSTLSGCAAKAERTTPTDEGGKTVYVYMPDGRLLASGTPDWVASWRYSDRIVEVSIGGKTYKTSWSNVVLVGE